MTTTKKVAGEYLNGQRCELCNRLTGGAVCQCRRHRAFARGAEEVDEWLNETLPDFEGDDRESRKMRRQIMMASSSALARSRRRAGLHGLSNNERSAFSGEILSTTVDDDERTGFKAQWDIDTEWHKPTSRWTPRADNEVV